MRLTERGKIVVSAGVVLAIILIFQVWPVRGV
jgi:hypothetical protein